MFTRIAKVLIWVMVAAVIIGGIFAFEESDEYGIVVWVVGFLLLFGLGLFVELANNVMDIRHYAIEIAKKSGVGYVTTGSPYVQNTQTYAAPAQTSVNSPVSNVPNVQKVSYVPPQPAKTSNGEGYNLSALAAEAEAEKSVANGQYCPECGRKHPMYAQQCSNCGRYL